MSDAPRKGLQAAWDDVGGLSKPSKMPGWGTSTPARRCVTGSKLRTVKGSTCSGCYALKGRYVFPNVLGAMERRYARLDSPTWVKSMAELVNALCVRVPYFRWHDSGDIQSVAHLARIVAVAVACPAVKFWLPTREYRIVQDYLRANPGQFPKNLCVRLSAHMADGAPPLGFGLPVSTVHTGAVPDEALGCDAPTRGGHCGPCRACWDSESAPWVSYHKH